MHGLVHVCCVLPEQQYLQKVWLLASIDCSSLSPLPPLWLHCTGFTHLRHSGSGMACRNYDCCGVTSQTSTPAIQTSSRSGENCSDRTTRKQLTMAMSLQKGKRRRGGNKNKNNKIHTTATNQERYKPAPLRGAVPSTGAGVERSHHCTCPWPAELIECDLKRWHYR